MKSNFRRKLSQERRRRMVPTAVAVASQVRSRLPSVTQPRSPQSRVSPTGTVRAWPRPQFTVPAHRSSSRCYADTDDCRPITLAARIYPLESSVPPAMVESPLSRRAPAEPGSRNSRGLRRRYRSGHRANFDSASDSWKLAFIRFHCAMLVLLLSTSSQNLERSRQIGNRTVTAVMRPPVTWNARLEQSPAVTVSSHCSESSPSRHSTVATSSLHQQMIRTIVVACLCIFSGIEAKR